MAEGNGKKVKKAAPKKKEITMVGRAIKFVNKVWRPQKDKSPTIGTAVEQLKPASQEKRRQKAIKKATGY